MVSRLRIGQRRPDIDAGRRHVDVFAAARVAIALHVLIDRRDRNDLIVSGGIARFSGWAVIAHSGHKDNILSRQLDDGLFQKFIGRPCQTHIDDFDVLLIEPVQRLDQTRSIACRSAVRIGIKDIGDIKFGIRHETWRAAFRLSSQ